MEEEIKDKGRKSFNDGIYHVARCTDIILSVVILAVIALTGIRLVLNVLNVGFFNMDIAFFSEFLSDALSLVVGAEFVKMLCRHSAQTVVEVLVYATARQMVVEHLETWQTLIGVAAIAILFAVRKYLMTGQDEKQDSCE